MSHFCYNRGCQKKYTPSDDPSKDENACVFHPGLPYFHDAYKIWSCCQKKSHDFNTFLSLPGCQHGPHEPNKPADPPAPPSTAPETTTSPPPPVETAPAPPPRPTIERPSSDAPLVKKNFTVAPSLQAALDKLNSNPASAGTTLEQTTDEIKSGTPCKHASCGKVYTTADDEQTTRCQFHPGVPIFHEGMKFWSCCQKKTTDFDAFTAQPGCTQGEHLWRNEAASSSSNEDDPQVLRSACRYDYHPQGPSIVLTIYAKMARPDQTTVEMHAGRLKVDTRFGPDQQTKRFANDWNLFGLIDVERSTVELLQTKIEITMKKAEPVNWTRLDRPVT